MTHVTVRVGRTCVDEPAAAALTLAVSACRRAEAWRAVSGDGGRYQDDIEMQVQEKNSQ